MFLKKFIHFKKKKHAEFVENPSKQDLFSNNINDTDSSRHDKTIVMETHSIPLEFAYLQNLISYRLGATEKPAFLSVDKWELPAKNYLKQLELDTNEDVATLVLIGLAPYVVPELFDQAIQEKINTSGDFPEIGGVRGKNFRGFLPTGQTAVFLLAGNDWQRRSEVEQLFWSDKDLARKKVLWLEQMELGQPVISGRIIMALDYIDLFLFDKSAPPHFSTSFPAEKITTELSVKDIMMNKEVAHHYENLKDWIKHNNALLNDWQMKNRFKKGFKVLFYGPPGTGKTLTANVLGNETKRDVYKVDISMVVSKYIGETEKNLELLFARAQEKNWILFFDEADAIFGKRTGVRDAHDKYANQEVSYLLQRIEEFDGLIILSTNMKTNIDDAFIRRFDDIVKFSLPTEEERQEIWEKIFSDKIEYGKIHEDVKKYQLSGANISNIIHFAGIKAIKRTKENAKTANADNDENKNGLKKCKLETEPDEKKLKYHLEDVLEGIKKEMIKEGRPFSF